MNNFSELIQEIIDEVIEEMSGTNAIAGYESPKAFTNKKKLKKDAMNAFGMELQDNEKTT